MSIHFLAIYDSPDYVNPFLAYFNTLGNLPIKPAGFTSYESLEDYLQEITVDILLIPQQEFSRELADMFKESSCREIVLLGDIQDLESTPKVINRYRPMKAVISDILDICPGMSAADSQPASGSAEIYSIYAPGRVNNRIRNAITLSGQLAEDGSPLYINLERFSGAEFIYDLHPAASLSDLIYFYLTNQEMLRRTLSSAICRIPGADMITAPLSPEDFDEIPSARLNDFFQLLAREGHYRYLFIDVGDSFRDLTGLFNISNSVYIYDAGADGAFEYPEILAFRKYFDSRGRTDILEKLHSMPSWITDRKEL